MTVNISHVKFVRLDLECLTALIISTLREIGVLLRIGTQAVTPGATDLYAHSRRARTPRIARKCNLMAPKLTPFAVKLRAAREAAGLSAAQLGAFVGVVPITIRRWEEASGEPTVSQLVVLAAALNTTASNLLDGTMPDPSAGLLGKVLAIDAADLVERVTALEDIIGRQQEDSDSPSA